eukprot:TRINITY_DN32510_c0_g1_i1.p1 TRINITY_DN32510_c0_g1~~TRINITY_DN32510_c0_g1_i1.p1  ORF type:complete len:310 (-),score=62.17 TRINITY_DN32510_c0_g1_i1:75-1004(-)
MSDADAPAEAAGEVQSTDLPVTWPLVQSQWVDPSSNEDPPAIGRTDMTDSMPCSFTPEQWTKLNDIQVLLTSVADVLETIGVTYFLSAGTLLGAYRHGNFICWDDDADICVPHELIGTIFESKAQALAKQQRFIFRHGFLPDSADGYYEPIAKYLQSINQPQGGDCCGPVKCKTATDGYFSRARALNPDGSLGETYVDIFHLIPVTLDGVTKYSDSCAECVFDYDDFFPPNQCVFGSRVYACPNRTRKYLNSYYQDISVPGTWDPDTKEQRGIDTNGTKFAHLSVMANPERQQIYEDQSGQQHFHIPEP